MEGVARQQGTARPLRQLDGEGRYDGDSTTMDDEDRASAMAMSMSTRPAVGAIKANAALNYKM
jgi:hypothetical protein